MIYLPTDNLATTIHKVLSGVISLQMIVLKTQYKLHDQTFENPQNICSMFATFATDQTFGMQ